MGRPTKFPRIKHSQLKELILAGFTDVKLCDFFGITEATLSNYKKKYPNFFASIQDWKAEADEKVEKSLLKRALGYEYQEVTTENMILDGKPLKGAEKKKTTIKEVVPDVNAQKFWLTNRQPKTWKEKVDVEHSGNLVVDYGHRKKKEEENKDG